MGPTRRNCSSCCIGEDVACCAAKRVNKTAFNGQQKLLQHKQGEGLERLILCKVNFRTPLWANKGSTAWACCREGEFTKPVTRPPSKRYPNRIQTGLQNGSAVNSNRRGRNRVMDFKAWLTKTMTATTSSKPFKSNDRFRKKPPTTSFRCPSKP